MNEWVFSTGVFLGAFLMLAKCLFWLALVALASVIAIKVWKYE